jgi:hypothetical protein
LSTGVGSIDGRAVALARGVVGGVPRGDGEGGVVTGVAVGGGAAK